jgi:hypothetical protein
MVCAELTTRCRLAKLVQMSARVVSSKLGFGTASTDDATPAVRGISSSSSGNAAVDEVTTGTGTSCNCKVRGPIEDGLSAEASICSWWMICTEGVRRIAIGIGGVRPFCSRSRGSSALLQAAEQNGMSWAMKIHELSGRKQNVHMAVAVRGPVSLPMGATAAARASSLRIDMLVGATRTAVIEAFVGWRAG